MTLRPVLIALAAGMALWVAACSPKPSDADDSPDEVENSAGVMVPDGDPTTAADAQAAQDAAMAASPTANDVPTQDATIAPAASASAHAAH